jgi:hypothetical protein
LYGPVVECQSFRYYRLRGRYPERFEDVADCEKYCVKPDVESLVYLAPEGFGDVIERRVEEFISG